MKNLSAFFISFFVFSFAAQAQHRDFSYHFGQFATEPVVCPYGDGWAVLVGFSDSRQNDIDSIALALIDKNGLLYHKQTIPTIPSERHYAQSILATPDNGLLLCYEGTVCDVGEYLTSLVKLDSNLQEEWKIEEDYLTMRLLPHKFVITPDGNYLGVKYKNVVKIDSKTGEFIWEKEIKGAQLSFNGYELMANTEDLVCIEHQAFYKLQQDFSPSDSIYTSSVLMDFQLGSAGSFSNLIKSPNSDLYRASYFNKDLVVTINPFTLDTSILDVGHGCYLLNETNDNLWISDSETLTIKSGSSSITQSAQLRNKQLYPFGSAQNQDKVIHIGTEVYPQLANFFNFKNYTNLWYRIYETDSIYNTTPEWSAALLSASTDQPFISSFGTIYGKDVKVRIKNTGNEIVDSVAVSYRRGDESGLCFSYFYGQKKFYNLNLQADQEVELDFGDITCSTHFFGKELCFWTSSLGPHPDAFHPDDEGCLLIPVSTSTPIEKIAAFFPNPTTGILHFQEKIEKPTDIQIYSILGQKVGQKTLQNADNQLDISLLAKGMYVLRWDGFYQKIILE